MARSLGGPSYVLDLGDGLLGEHVELGQELLVVLGPAILVQEGHGMDLTLHPGAVGGDEHVVLGVALG